MAEPPSIQALSLEEEPKPGQEETSESNQRDDDNDSSAAPHRSHSPTKNLKRSDPFQFGSRYLQPEDDVFEFNAWDHVTPDAAYDAYAESQYALHRQHPVSEWDKRRLNAEPHKWWDRFYGNNSANFFKNRKWLRQEFPVMSECTTRGVGRKLIVEVGAGAGNTAFPILKENENEECVVYACDFSSKAVQLIRNNEAFDEKFMRAEVWDVASSSSYLPPGLEEGSADVVLLIFVFSALSPSQWDAAVRNVYRILKPGGEVCFRDYGRGDLTQVRFRKGRYLEEGFYIRGDGTRVYFFGEEELRWIWAGGGDDNNNNKDGDDKNNDGGGIKDDAEDRRPAPDITDENKTQKNLVLRPCFNILSLGADRRMLVNRQRKLKMYRCWMQGRFQKPKDNMIGK